LGKPSIVLLPGLDGTGQLFARFILAAPPQFAVTSIALPPEALSYNDLADHVERNLPVGEPVVVIAESFSGPVALALAVRRPVAALVLCNSFVAAPRWRPLRWFIWPVFFGLRLPRFLVRRYMVGEAADDALVDHVAEVVASVPGSVLAARLRLRAKHRRGGLVCALHRADALYPRDGRSARARVGIASNGGCSAHANCARLGPSFLIAGKSGGRLECGNAFPQIAASGLTAFAADSGRCDHEATAAETQAIRRSQ
jgi:pimeloyl-ACP methyl ester carboxylesterase